MAAFSPRKDSVKNYRVHPTHLLIYAQVVNHVFACIWYYLGADDFSEECSAAAVPARDCTWMQVHGLHPHRTVWNSPPRRVA